MIYTCTWGGNKPNTYVQTAFFLFPPPQWPFPQPECLSPLSPTPHLSAKEVYTSSEVFIGLRIYNLGQKLSDKFEKFGDMFEKFGRDMWQWSEWSVCPTRWGVIIPPAHKRKPSMWPTDLPVRVSTKKNLNQNKNQKPVLCLSLWVPYFQLDRLLAIGWTIFMIDLVLVNFRNRFWGLMCLIKL